jgi:hypothetical protein
VSLLMVACLVALAAIGTTVLADGNLAIRGLVALPLVLFAPGYAVASALLSARWRRGVEMVVLSLGLSLLITAIGGLALGWTSWGLTARSWTIVLSGVTLGAGAVSMLRSRQEDAGASQLAARLAGRGLPLRDRLLLGLTGLTLVGALLLAQIGAALQPADGFTQLWISPPSPADPAAIQLGMRSQESTATTFRVQLNVGGQTVREWGPLVLEPGENWDATAVLPPVTDAATDGRVEAVVYRQDGSSPGGAELPYRRVTLSR